MDQFNKAFAIAERSSAAIAVEIKEVYGICLNLKTSKNKRLSFSRRNSGNEQILLGAVVMIDLTDGRNMGNIFGGSEKKKRILFNGETYLVKFPDPVREERLSLSYMNNQFSEYIGCHIISSLGIKTQDTFLAKYNDGEEDKVVVACRVFTSENLELMEFFKVEMDVTELDNKFSNNIEDIYTVIQNSTLPFNKKEMLDDFWNMFVADALIGNPDRHLDDFGFLYDKENDTYTFAPIYDCGSSLLPFISLDKKKDLLKNPMEFEKISYNVKTAFFLKKKRVLYSEIFKNPPKDLKKAILRIVPKINMELITDIIFSTPGLSETDATFILEDIKIRKDLIIDKAFEKIQKEMSMEGTLIS